MDWKIENLDNLKSAYIPEVGEAFAYFKNDGKIYDSAYIRVDNGEGARAIKTTTLNEKIFALNHNGKIVWFDTSTTPFAPLNVSFTLKG